MIRLLLVAVFVAVSLPSLLFAQVAIPFQVTGGGTADCLSAIPGDYSNYNGTGNATLLGDYVLDMATVGIRSSAADDPHQTLPPIRR